MWNESLWLRVFVSVKDVGKRRTWLPLFVWTQCLSSYLEDIADVLALFPAKGRMLFTQNHNMTFGQASATSRAGTALLRGLHGLRVRVRIRQNDGGFAKVDVGA